MIKVNFRIYQIIKWCFVICFFTAMTIILTSPNTTNNNEISFNEISSQISLPTHSPLKPPGDNWRNFTQKQIQSLSVLGRYIFLDNSPPSIDNPDKIYKILTWKVGKFLERRHFYHFTNQRFDPFEKCSVRNCKISYNENDLATADAVLFHLQRLKGVNDLPKENGLRPKNQRWVFLTDENPLFTFLNKKIDIAEFNGKFNWSMTYRIESDVPVPYGRTVLKNSNIFYSIINMDYNKIKDDDIFSIRKRSDVLVAAMGSNCGSKNHRWKYVKELQKYIKVDFYGHCGTLKCPGHFSKDCEPIGDYKFFLSFENSNCAQYMTEKVWWNAYAKNSIPVVMGASKLDYEQLLPPNSFINVEDFARPIDLARYIDYVNKTYDIYQSFFEWKKYYQVSNEHGYFQSDSYHYCRLCEALNYNSRDKKVYDHLEKFWTKNDCYSRWDE